MEYRLWLAGKEQDGNADLWVMATLTLELALMNLQHSHRRSSNRRDLRPVS